MKGLALRSFKANLHKVPVHQRLYPVRAIKRPEDRVIGLAAYREAYFGAASFSFLNEYHHLPLQMFADFSFDELCKLRYSSTIMMDKTVTTLFETKAQYEIVRKIENSMWRWSGKGEWNEIVDAYNGIRHFTLIEDARFEVRLDHTGHCDECGWSKYGRRYLDGVFGFLVYYKGVHVFTVGFSLLRGKRIYIQQVQSTKRSGNRWRYQLPHNLVEFVIDRFTACFPGYALFIVDGGSLSDKIRREYETGLQLLQARRIKSADDEEREKKLEADVAHVTNDRSRLAALYRAVGKYSLGPPRGPTYRLMHHPVLA